ncbi:hypothetical protein Tco_0673526 [Tanacetum coccineum]
MKANKLPEMDPYEEVAQQGQAHPLSPAYVPDPIELDEHVPVYVPDPEHPKYYAPSDDDIQVKDQPYANYASPTAESPGYIADSDSMEEDTDEDSIDYPDEPEDGEEVNDEDPEEDPSEEHEPEEDGDDDDTHDEDEEPIMDEEEEKHLAPADGHRAAMICIRDDIPEEDMPPQRRFVLTTPLPGCDVAESSAAVAARPPKAADREDDVGYVRALHASEHRMMTSIEEVNLRVNYQEQIRKQEKLHEVRQAYLSSKARNRALLAQLETLETHMSRMEWQRQRAEDDAVRQMMRTHVLEARAQIDTVEDTDSSC